MSSIQEPTEANAASNQPTQEHEAPSAPQTSTAPSETLDPAEPMSKNARKRLRRIQEWEDGREDRKVRRREKRHKTKARRREERAELIAQGADPAALFAKRTPAVRVPVSLILDCNFEEYMTDRESVSMSSQVTRCYADNRNFKYKSHFWISGWRGNLKERFETTMEKQHVNWKGVGFEAGDFLATAVRAREQMSTNGGEMIDALKRSVENKVKWEKDTNEPFPLPGPLPELNEEYKDVVYLSSESPYTLQRLEPNTSYIIGGLVDKNREKGLCYKLAVEKGIRTARLPIGQYMKLRTRQILATNHVVEIMLRWLECEDWAEAFRHVIPKRKGAEVIGDRSGQAAKKEHDEDGDEDEDEEVDEEQEEQADDEGHDEAAT